MGLIRGRSAEIQPPLACARRACVIARRSGAAGGSARSRRAGVQLIVSVGGIAVLIPLLVWLSGRIYRNAVVRSGARVRLSDAWRPA